MSAKKTKWLAPVGTSVGVTRRAQKVRTVPHHGARVASTGTEAMSTNEPANLQEFATTDEQTDNERPDDCQCIPPLADEVLPCWPCYREDFEEANEDALEGGESQ